MAIFFALMAARVKRVNSLEEKDFGGKGRAFVPEFL